MKQTEKAGARNRIGALGEAVAVKEVLRRGWTLLDQNYLQKWGELDVVARDTAGNIHFIEVKAVSYETIDDLEQAVSRATWRPEENVHRRKLARMARAIETWIQERAYAGPWQIDVVAVRLVPSEQYATVSWLENVILD